MCSARRSVKECTREALQALDQDFAKLAKTHELADGQPGSPLPLAPTSTAEVEQP